MKRALALVLALLAATGCDRRDRFAAPDSTSAPEKPAVPARGAYLSVSDMSPEAGSDIIVTGTLAVSDKLSLGSFRVRLGFDSTKLRFLEEIPSPDMMRVVNPRAGDVIVVGASSTPSVDGKLFTFRLRVEDPAGINSLVLRIDELNDTAFRDQRATVTQAAALVHDRSLERLVESEMTDTARGPVTQKGVTPGVTIHPGADVMPVVDSISPRTGELDSDRVTDIIIYGKGFAARGNLVLFGNATIPGLMSEAGGTVIRFSAPSIRVTERVMAVRVQHDGMQSNAVFFTVKSDKP
jgi:hypothetical protein